MKILDLFRPRAAGEAPASEADLLNAVQQAAAAVRTADSALGSALMTGDPAAVQAARRTCSEARDERADAEVALTAWREAQARIEAQNKAAAAEARWDKAAQLAADRDRLAAKVQKHLDTLAGDFKKLADITDELANTCPAKVRSECGDLLDLPRLAFAAARYLFKAGLTLPAPKANESDRVTIPELASFVEEGGRAVLRRRPSR